MKVHILHFFFLICNPIGLRVETQLAVPGRDAHFMTAQHPIRELCSTRYHGNSKKSG
ncbi:hypothetical protein J4Q44_G00084110 [Coregonus suidteri]|uniref:Uncharacterized protein n=1 Tax=Coregonus suidteri TaxID=861788 RepID=A0AAN8LYW1_9TELE